MLEVIGYMFIGVFFALLVPVLKAWAESKDTWVGLTDKEILKIWKSDDEPKGVVEFVREIEAKLKEKNT
jgi:hypothetical protein